MDPSRINNPYFIPGNKTELPSERKLHTCAGAARKKAMEAPGQDKSDSANPFIKGHIHQKKASRSMIGLRREADEQAAPPSVRNHAEVIDLKKFIKGSRSSSLSNSWIQFSRPQENRASVDSDVSSHSKRLDEIVFSYEKKSKESISKGLSNSLSEIKNNKPETFDDGFDKSRGVPEKVNTVFTNLIIKTLEVLPQRIVDKLKDGDDEIN